jgi:hypothetical protein
VRVRDGEEGERVEAKQGSVPDPDLVVTGDVETVLAVVSGRRSPEEAVRSQALRAEGGARGEPGSLARVVPKLDRPDSNVRYGWSAVAT